MSYVYLIKHHKRSIFYEGKLSGKVLFLKNSYLNTMVGICSKISKTLLPSISSMQMFKWIYPEWVFNIGTLNNMILLGLMIPPICNSLDTIWYIFRVFSCSGFHANLEEIWASLYMNQRTTVTYAEWNM